MTTFIKKDITFEQSLRITNWNTPSNPEIHINKDRRLLVRECALIQTFPDDFIFTGSLSSIFIFL
jgi:cytosine-specific methyltransferase